MRILAALALSVVLALTGLALAIARGEMAVVCAGGAGPTITVPGEDDAAPRFCPEAGLGFLAAIAPDPAPVGGPALRLVALVVAAPAAAEVPAAVGAASARGPPSGA
jgi:hypothetical protein